jgi:hypothetical protein
MMATAIERSPFWRAAEQGLAVTGPGRRGTAKQRRPHPGKDVKQCRIEEVARCILDGAMNGDVMAFIRQREGDEASAFFVGEGRKPLSYSQLTRYIVGAKKLIAKTVEEDRQELIGKHVAMRRHLYARAVSRDDVRAALSILDSEANLLGLFPDKSVHVSGANGGLNLQVLVQAVIAAETKTVETVRELEAVPCESTALIGGGDDDAKTSGGECRDAAAVVGSEAVP